MRRLKGILGYLFLALVLVAAFNFFADNRPTEAKARTVACSGRGPKCTASMTRLFRTPLWQDIQFRVAGQTVEVRCARTAYLFGEQACAVRQ
jgi:hypothetical protein